MSRPGLRGRRRGSALILVLLMTLAVAALAIAAIFMSSSASLLSRFYDKERQFAYAAQSGIERVVARLKLDSSFAVTSTTPVLALTQTTLRTASDSSLAGVTVRVWAARTGDTTSSGPITISLLAQVADANGTRFARRADLRQLHFGQWAFITNTGTSSSSLPFASFTVVAGRVHANDDWATITQAAYRDSITSAGTVGTTNAASLRTGKGEDQPRIPWPSADSVIAVYESAAGDSLRFDVDASQPARVELVWLDLDADGAADRDEGFLRIFEAQYDQEFGYLDKVEIRSDGLDGGSNEFVVWADNTVQSQCGAFYRRNGVWQFFPVATHRAAWAWAIIDSASAVPAGPPGGNSNTQLGVRAILSGPTARCFPSGSPYLVNTERFTDSLGTVGIGGGYIYPFGAVAGGPRYGGQDTTLTVTVQQCSLNGLATRCNGGSIYTVGSWRLLSTAPGRETLAPLDRAGRGAVVHFDDDIWLGGSLAGRVTIAVEGRARLVDHLTYAAAPNAIDSECAHLLGVVAEDYIRIEENLVAHRTRVGSNAGLSSMTMLGGADHFPLHGAFLSLEEYFGVEGNAFRQGNSNTSDCEGLSVSMGCIRHVGSAAMHRTREFSTGPSRGGRYVVSPDACMERGFRPPFYPATNRFVQLRAVDVRPSSIIGLNGVPNYFARLQGISDIP